MNICPNLKNKEVAKEFNELLEATSENAAYHIWSENNGHGIDKAPNGEPSKLFADLLSHYDGDRKLAIQAKAKTFSNSFKTWFGESKIVDVNDEPLVLWHGTEHDFEEFEQDVNNKRGKHLVHVNRGFFFTDSKEKALKYKHKNAMPAYLLALTPGVSSVVEDNVVNNINKENEILLNDVYDSAIFTRFDKEGDNNGLTPTTQYVVKHPNQIKSIDNQGSFSTESNVIYEQRNADPIEAVSSFVLNKLNIRSKEYRPRTNRNKQVSGHKQDYVINSISALYKSITGLELDANINSISELIDNIKFELHNNLVDKWKNKLTEIESSPVADDIRANYYAQKNMFNTFLQRGEVDALSEYDEHQQALIKQFFPKLFEDSNFKSSKQAFAFYLRNLKTPTSSLNAKIEKEANSRNLQTLIYNAKVGKYKTLINFSSLVHDYAHRIESKLLSELSRSSEFYEHQSTENEKTSFSNRMNEISKKFAESGLFQDESKLANLKESPNINKYFTITKPYLYGTEQVIADSSIVGILTKIANGNTEYAKYAKYLLNSAKDQNIQVLLLSGKKNAAGSTHFKFDNTEGKTKVKEANITIDYDSDRYRKNPERLLLHEITHALTSLRLAGDKTLESAIEGYIQHCRKYIKENMNVNFMIMSPIVNGFQDSHEFIADFFTYPEFQELLKAIPPSDPVKFKNIFQEILNTILSWFKTPQNAYEQILPVMEKIVEQQMELNVEETFFNEVEYTKYQTISQQSSIDPVKLSNILKIDDTYKRLITALTLRVKDVKNAANLDIKERQSIELHLQLVNNLEASQALIQYIPLMQNDIASTVNKINELNDKLLQAQATGETIDIPATVLLDIKRGFLGFYSDVITSMQDVLEDINSVDYLTNKGISAKDLQIYKDDLIRIASDYHNINRKYENLVTYQATNNIINYAKERGSTTVELLRRNLLFADKDLGTIERFVYSPIHSNDEILTQVADRLVGAKNATERSVLSKGKKLVKLTEDLSRAEVQSLFEKTKNGKKTAYLVRPLNHGEYQMNKVAKQTALANEYGLPDIYERPQDRKQLIEYNRKMNEWYDANAERRYTKDYYDLFNNLSPEASSARESIQMEIRMIYHDVTDNKGNVHLEDLTSAQWGNILALSKQKRDLANPYNLDGTAKIGTDKDVAAEITKLNEALKGNVKYKADLPAFKEAYLTAKRTLTEEKLLKWITRNTVKVVKQEFYDALARLAEPKSNEYEALKTERNNLQKLYKTEDGSIDADFMPNNVKARLVEINTTMSEMMEFETTTNPEKAGLFNKVAKVIVNEGYAVAWDLAASQGDDVLANWVSLNTYQAQYKDGTSGVRPASFWTQVVPVDEKMYTHKPSAQWSTIEESSNFVNPNFDQSSKEFSIPKKSKYDNSVAYNKVRNNAKVSKLYDGVYDMLNESNGMLDFIHKTDNYRLPQIEANSLETIGKANSIKEGISTSLQNALSIRDTDTEYEGASPAVRSDGSYVKLIPTRYLKALDDPNTITDDIVGATIAYYSMALNHKNMRKIEPEMNLIIDQMGSRKAEGGEPGNEMRVYKRAIELMDMHMYGRRRQRGKNDEFTVFGKKISKSKLAFGFASFLRLSTLSHNINVIATGLITNKMNTRIEALAGEYFDSATLAKAAKEVAFSYPSMIASLGKVKTTNKLSAFMEYNQVVFNNAEMFNNLHKSRVARTLQKHFWYGGHTMVDYSTKGRLTAAVYFNYKLVGDKFMNFSEFRTNNKELSKKELNKKWHGLTTTLYDAYELSGETITLKKEHANRVSSILEDRVKNTIQMIGSRIDGQLSDIDRASIHTNCYAAFFVMFRNFMIQMIQTRFKPAHFNYSKGNWDEGYYRATANYISRHVFNKEKLTQLKELCDNFAELDEMERTAVERVASEMLINLLMFTIMSQVLSAFADDDKRDWVKQEIAYLVTRTRLELSTPYNPLDLMNMLQNPTAAVPYLNTVMTLGELVFNPSDEVKSGPYKGNTKLFKAAMKLTPGKMYYEALDPASKRRYLENQVMKGDFLGSLAKSATAGFMEKE